MLNKGEPTMKEMQFYKFEESATYAVSDSDRAIGVDFEGSYKEIFEKYAPDLYTLSDVVEKLEEQDLFLFRKELVISNRRYGYVVVKGDIIEDIFKYIQEKIGYDGYDDIYITEYDVEGTMEWINDNTDFKAEWHYDMEI